MHCGPRPLSNRFQFSQALFFFFRAASRFFFQLASRFFSGPSFRLGLGFSFRSLNFDPTALEFSFGPV